ncbi:MAG TPA: YfaZ family outer membrane protein [Steroidobacteraceae bacterium]|jgi:hypothetical protein|nr:YfaZ family outer membrane protein [Steroidobacteraceae bacterium]
MRTLSLTFCALALVAALPLRAQEPRTPTPGSVIEGTAGDHALQMRYLTAAPFQSIPSDLDYGLLVSNQHNVIGSAAWLIHTDLDLVPHLSFDIGPQAYVASLAEQSRGILATSVGGDARLDLIPRLGIAAYGSAFYAPSVLVFGAANNVYDFTAGVQVRFAPRLLALAGYRWFRYSLQNSPDDTVQNSVFVGMRWNLGQ